MTAEIPESLKYSKEHEWVKVEGSVATIGISHHAQDQLGDIVYVELPAVERELKAMEEFGVVESVKSVSSLYCPVSGKVIEVNAALNAAPQTLNSDPYGEGWIIKVALADALPPGLLTAEEYQQLLAR